MKIAVMHRTEDYRGDHAADVSIAIDTKEGETVEDLAKRVLRKDRPQDWIEVRVVKECDENN